MSNIEQEMAGHMDKCHKQARDKVSKARKAIADAVDASIEVGELVDKVRSHYKSGANQWLADNTSISADEARAYTSTRYTSTKRNAREDKRCLQLLGILNKQPARTTTRRVTKASPATIASKASASVMRAIKARPVASMSKSERDVLKMNLRDIASLYVEACK